MPHALVTPDFDPIDPARTIDLADVGLPDFCATVAIDSDGVETLLLAQYDLGAADYLPLDWEITAPHEVIGTPVYMKH